jgi:hypothetical protein
MSECNGHKLFELLAFDVEDTLYEAVDVEPALERYLRDALYVTAPVARVEYERCFRRVFAPLVELELRRRRNSKGI